MRNVQLAELFEEIADLLEVKGESAYRVQAYRRAARSLEQSGESAETLMREGRLEELPNIGEALAAKITEVLTTCHLTYLDKLREEIPRSAHDLMNVPGIGPQTAGRMVRE